jgi:hypothetical protein
MQFKVLLAALALLFTSCLPLRAANLDDKTFDQDSINALQAKILQSTPKEQCFLYAELLHQMTEVSVRQYASGDDVKAHALLKQVQVLAHKRLKNAQILLRHTAFRLTEMLHSSSLEDQPLLADTLAQVNKAQDETMLEVFRK